MNSQLMRRVEKDYLILQYMNGNGYILKNDGSIWSVKKGEPKKLKPQISTSGYYYLDLSLNGINQKFVVHRIVWVMNFGLVPYGLEINHKDGNKLNNSLDNLELVTSKENTRHSFRNGLRPTKLTPADVVKIRDEYKPRKITQLALSKKYGVSRSIIGEIVRNELYVLGRCDARLRAGGGQS